MRTRLLSFGALAAAAALAAALLVAAPARSAPLLTNGCIDSVPDPGTNTPVKICYSLFRPEAASASNRVPLVFHSHGWAGSRTKAEGSFSEWMQAGFGILSFDQRGFGESGGLAHVENPDLEGQDVIRLVDMVSRLDWVEKDRRGDPTIGAIGGSYGGGYQYVGAFTELRDRGRTRFDALAPQMTWWDVKESLAPDETPRTGWVSALYAAGARDIPQEIHRGFAYAVTTNEWPRGQDPVAPNLDKFFEKNGPAWHVSQGRRLDIPTLMYQGHTDNLFNLNQGLKNFEQALTPRARARSYFVGYNGGHALPSAVPTGTQVSGDPCSATLLPRDRDKGGSAGIGEAADYDEVARRFMVRQLKGIDSGMPRGGRYWFATNGNRCLTTGSSAPDQSFRLPAFQSPSAAGAPVQVAVAEGPITVAGVPRLDASVTTVGLDTRVFFGLSVGTSPADARLVQNNMMPLREPVIVAGARRSMELPGVAVEVPKGQRLFLTVSGIYDMSFGNGARVPGLVALADPVLHLNTRL
jgi:ABC-2 type transport system ATP-binding protein